MWTEFIIKVLAILIDRYYQGTKAEEKFYELVAEMEMGGMRSVRLRESYREQVDAYKSDRPTTN